ncbi:MAG: nucleotide exchange factor GrpE [Phycisphaera sp.]|nr:nucleotide exchange factor GrpE [Phycisphaera sp.]
MPEQEDNPIDELAQAQADQAGEDKTQAGVEDELAKLRAERDDLQSKLMRSFADYQNALRRSQISTEQAREQRTMDMARELVAVLDHFDKALEVDPAKTDAQTLLQGVQIVRDELTKSLEKFGVKRLDVKVGEEFDPNRHEAMLHQPAQGVASNHVSLQLQPGYLINDKTLRPAKVSVAP